MPSLCMRTVTGRSVCPSDLRPEDLLIDDIAHSLAHQCRFAGHVREFYSVAQHSVLVSLLCAPEDALWGLLHDASEAYLNDLISPVKNLTVLAGYRALEDRVMQAVCQRFNLPPVMPVSVRAADVEVLRLEERTLRQPTPTGGFPMELWMPRQARAVFLAQYQELALKCATATKENRAS